MNRTSNRTTGRRRAVSCIASILLSIAMTLTLMPSSVFAGSQEGSDATVRSISMTEGEVIEDFAGAGTGFTSADPSVAWVDEKGRLNALKEGSTVIKASSGGTYDVTVSDYDDGSDTVGRLKILARYNDSMQFYDGHVYLLFTSYKNGVDISVDDLYGAYEISDKYYSDIRDDISAGSNHSGTGTDEYFTFNKKLHTMVLDRGEIVTIGMYRGFDLSVEQAALGSLRNSSLWGGLRKAGKTAAVEALFSAVNGGDIPLEAAINKLGAIVKDAGLDLSKWTDGVVEGGVCFNRELYNQKLEWDQFENVTYELDITQDQLDRLVGTLSGNHDRFSMMSNSCATVAVEAWNAAVGVRDGKDSAYKLYTEGGDLLRYFDAPKGVRDCIVARLPGYYLNNSEGVEEPDAGFRDDTGWVYVSAPEKLPEDGDDQPAADCVLKTSVSAADEADIETEFYTLDGNTRTEIDETAVLDPGTRIYIKTTYGEAGWYPYAIRNIILNGSSVFDLSHFDEDENAYFAMMPDKPNSKLSVIYDEANVSAKGNKYIQIREGGNIDIADHAGLAYGSEEAASDRIRWRIVGDSEDSDVLQYTDDSHRTLRCFGPGEADVWAYADGNDRIGVMYHVEVYDAYSDMCSVSIDGSEAVNAAIMEEDGENSSLKLIPFSGYLVEKGSVLRIYPAQNDGTVISQLTCSGSVVGPGETVTADSDLEIKVRTKAAEVAGVPETVSLTEKGESYMLDAKVRYKGLLAGFLPVYDPEVTYESSDPLVSVSESGLIKLEGDVPEDGSAVYVTAYAGSSNRSVCATCKVIVGDYKGDEIVGRMTIYARPSTPSRITPHSAVNFITYSDLDMDISCYEQFMPNDKYNSLMRDYEEHPEKYSADPAVYNEDFLGISREERETYFDYAMNGALSEPQTFSLKAGESINISSSGYEESNLVSILKSLEDGEIADSRATAELIRQIRYYLEENEVLDGEKAFDGLTATLREMYEFEALNGYNPATGLTTGGMHVNQEVYKQFISEKSQLPNKYYSIEITADELAMMKKYLSDPDNNQYVLFNKNCTTCAKEIWNATLSDRPEYIVKANSTGIVDDPMSLYAELALMSKRSMLRGEGGSDFYPRIMAYRDQSGDKPADDPSDSRPDGSSDAADPDKASGGSSAQTSAQDAQVSSKAAAGLAKALNSKLSIKVSRRGRMTLKWGKVDGADGYDIFVRRNDGKNIFTKKTAGVKSGSKLSKKLKKLNGRRIRADKKYRFAVKAYRMEGGRKVYLCSSKVKTSNKK